MKEKYADVRKGILSLGVSLEKNVPPEQAEPGLVRAMNIGIIQLPSLMHGAC